MELPLIAIILFLAATQLSSAEESRESKKLPDKYLQIPEKIIGGVIDIVQSHKNKQPYAQAGYQAGYQTTQGNYQANGNLGYQQWTNQNNNQLQGQFAANQGGQGYIQLGTNQGMYPNQPNYQGQTQIQISNSQSNNQYQNQNQNQQNGQQFQNQMQANQFQNQNQIQNNRFDNVNYNQNGQYQGSQQRPQYQGGNNGYGQYQGGSYQGGSYQGGSYFGTQYPAAQQPVTPITQYPSQNGGQYQGTPVTNQENYYQGNYGNYQNTQTGQYQNGSQFNQGSSQNTGSSNGQPNSGPGPTCICQAWTKPLSDEMDQQYTPAPKTEPTFEPTTLLM